MINKYPKNPGEPERFKQWVIPTAGFQQHAPERAIPPLNLVHKIYPPKWLMYLDSNIRPYFAYVHSNAQMDYIMKTDGFMRMEPFSGWALQITLLNAEHFGDHTAEAADKY